MSRIILITLMIILLSGCEGLPTLEVSAAAIPTTLPTALIPTAAAVIVQITGDVYVRDDQDKVIGWLYKGDEAPAACSGDWCQIVSGRYRSYHFWRGCSSDNPERKSCQAR